MSPAIGTRVWWGRSPSMQMLDRGEKRHGPSDHTVQSDRGTGWITPGDGGLSGPPHFGGYVLARLAICVWTLGFPTLGIEAKLGKGASLQG